MGFIDNFTSDTPVEIKHDEYYALMREAAKAELLINGIEALVPTNYLKAFATGKKVEEIATAVAVEETIELNAAWCDPNLEANAWGRLTAAVKDIYNDCQDETEIAEIGGAIRGIIDELTAVRRQELFIKGRREEKAVKMDATEIKG